MSVRTARWRNTRGRTVLYWGLCAVIWTGIGGCRDAPVRQNAEVVTATDASAILDRDALDVEIADTERVDLDNTVSFERVLDEYRALNARLERVSFDLRRANVALCPVTVRDIGVNVHTVFDYPENLQPVARALLGVSEKLSLRTVRDGSPADAAGLRSGDQIRAVNGQYMSSGFTADRLYAAMTARAFSANDVQITVLRGDTEITQRMAPQTLCAYPANVFFSETVNGHTDGQDVWITSELLRTVPDDVNLALVVAHEMAHAIAGHMGEPPSKTLELLADQMGLIMLARAGYDIDRAVEYWQYAPHPHGAGGDRSQTHPSMGERLNNFRATLRRIRVAEADDRPLDFNLVSNTPE